MQHKTNLMRYLSLILVVVGLSNCTKDRDLVDMQYTINGDQTLLHHWHFNNSVDINDLLLADYSVDYAFIEVEAARWDESGDGSDLNLLDGQNPGDALRIRNPSQHIDLVFTTKGYGNISLSFATMRTNNGAKKQQISYAIDGSSFTEMGIEEITKDIQTDWQLHTFDFSYLPSLANREMVTIRIVFSEGNNGDSGNNRFDNISILGSPISAD